MYRILREMFNMCQILKNKAKMGNILALRTSRAIPLFFETFNFTVQVCCISEVQNLKKIVAERHHWLR